MLLLPLFPEGQVHEGMRPLGAYLTRLLHFCKFPVTVVYQDCALWISSFDGSDS